MVQWLRRHASAEEGAGLIPGQGTKIPRTAEYLSSHTVTRESLLLNKQKEIPHIASKT